MAELGDILLTGGDPKVDHINVMVEMMDYSYVSECSCVMELKAILKKLRSGEEGRYPDLERTVETKIIVLLPDKERRQFLAMKQQPTVNEISVEQGNLDVWLQQMNQSGIISDDDDAIFDKSRVPQEIRPSLSFNTTSNRNSENQSTALQQSFTAVDHNKDRICKERLSNRDYFRAWDKFDVDAAEKILDDEDYGMIQQTSVMDAKEVLKVKEMERRKRIENELQNLQSTLQVDDLTAVERKYFAQREKNKGNECFKIGENESAVLFYSRSIAFNDQNGIVFANRAMASIRLKNYEQGMDDCNKSIKLNPAYTKAFARRGMIHHKRGHYDKAIADFGICCEREPQNQEYCRLNNCSKNQQKLVNDRQQPPKKKQENRSNASKKKQHRRHLSTVQDPLTTKWKLVTDIEEESKQTIPSKETSLDDRIEILEDSASEEEFEMGSKFTIEIVEDSDDDEDFDESKYRRA